MIGCSSGGAAALTMGWFRPDLFRRILACSGSFVDHENVEAFEAARGRGCGTVLSKRKLSAELPELVATCRT